MCPSWLVFAQKSNGIICFYLRHLELTEIRIWSSYVIIWYDFGGKNSPFGGQKLSYRLEILFTSRRLVGE